MISCEYNDTVSDDKEKPNNDDMATKEGGRSSSTLP
jgi:hypothetical protein